MSKNKGQDKYFKKSGNSNKDSIKKDSYQNDKVNLVNVLKKDKKKERNGSKVSASLNEADLMQHDKGEPQATS